MQYTKPAPLRALISTADKVGLVAFAKNLTELNFEIIATGNTARLLKENHLSVIDISEITGFPEMMDGRVKTLHPNIHAGILARRDQDSQTLRDHNITPIDLVVVNLYPFEKTIKKTNCPMNEAIEQIDIGGPTLLRAAAKNHRHVTVITDPNDYDNIAQELKQHGLVSTKTRQRLAVKVFQHTHHYDGVIADYLASQVHSESKSVQLNLSDPTHLRYGENPHQEASLYTPNKHPGSLAQAKIIQGKPLSYNNLMDANAALHCVRMWPKEQAACAIIKHATPCGIAIADTLDRAYSKALSTDPVSAFGGIVALNQPLDEATAQHLSRQFVEVIIAPSITEAAQTSLKKKKNCRILLCQTQEYNPQPQITTIDGGILIQSDDISTITREQCQTVTNIKPSVQQSEDLWFAWQVVRQVKSNAIVFAKNGMTLGIGAGQTSRVFSVKIAALKAQEAGFDLTGSVMASDAFFPFSDGIEEALQHGITAVIQPGGSKRDHEVISAADAAQISMVFTGQRHFKH